MFWVRLPSSTKLPAQTPLEQLLFGNDAIGVLSEIKQYIEGLGSECDRLALAKEGTLARVQRKRAEMV
jgi:hypothetical protein